ncbi:MAG: Type fimbrial biosis protein PilY1, partial [Burkholderiaceae bacterium]|nr:Type fimbrial biosis protein PilY1 [Burkholderiaceae bacterium]
NFSVAEGATVNMGGNVVQNVAPGVNGTDAVNVNQLNAMGARVESNLNNLDKKLSARVAAAVALESAPYIPRKFTYYVGTGYSGGQAALGASFRKTSDNGRWSVTGGIAGSGVGGVTARIGFTGIID